MSDKRLPSSSHTPEPFDDNSSRELSDPRHTSQFRPNSPASAEQPVKNYLHDPDSPPLETGQEFDGTAQSSVDPSHIGPSHIDPSHIDPSGVDFDETTTLPGYELASVTTLLRQAQSPPHYQPDAAQPDAAQPSTAQPSAAQPSTAQPRATQPRAGSGHEMFRPPQDRDVDANRDVPARPRPAARADSTESWARQSPFQRSDERLDQPHQPDSPPADSAREQSAVGGAESSFGRRGNGPAAAVSPLVAVYQQHDARARVQSVQRSLDDAAEKWWTESQLPSKALLRNGLLVLEAGHSLEEVQRTLLLRTALRYRRGMLTALKHQTDPDRTAYLLKEALLFERNPLSTETLWMLQTEDPAADEWGVLLDDDLRYHLQSLGSTRHGLAMAAIQQLNSDELISQQALRDAATVVMSSTRPFGWTVGRVLLLLLVVPALISVYSLRAQHSTLTGMASIPEGQYEVGLAAVDQGGASDGGIGMRSVFIPDGFAIDQTEVTNERYRLCVQQGVCREPVAMSSETQDQYYLNPLYNSYPVVHVDWYMARQYCEWAGKRLPTVNEWEIAASTAPATSRRFDYPWGDTYAQQYANSNPSNIGDTKEVGSYHPTGTSPTGATDMAGNVAEWTTTDTSPELYEVQAGQIFIAKGGSYRDQPNDLRSSVGKELASNTTMPWLGFRCAMTLKEATPEEDTREEATR